MATSLEALNGPARGTGNAGTGHASGIGSPPLPALPASSLSAQIPGLESLDNATLTSVVRQLAVQNKLLQDSLVEMREKQKDLIANQSLITSTLMSDLSKLSASTEMSTQEIKFLKEQHMSHRGELQSHLKYLDDHLAKTKEEMLLLANQVAAQDRNSKAWTEHMTKALDFVNQDNRDRGIATAKLSEKILGELNVQRLRSDEIESQFKSTVREIALQQAQANAQAMAQLQTQLESLLVGRDTESIPEINQSASGSFRLPRVGTGNSSPPASSPLMSSTAQPSSALPSHRAQSPRQSSQAATAAVSAATADQRIFHQSVRNVTEAYQDTVKGELATMRTQLASAKLSLEDRFVEQSRQLRTALQGMKSEIEALKNDFAGLSSSANNLEKTIIDRVRRAEEALASLSDRTELRVHKVQTELSALGEDCLSAFAGFRTKISALQTQQQRIDTPNSGSAMISSNASGTVTKALVTARAQGSGTGIIPPEVQREINRLSRDFKDLVAVMRETHANQNRRIEQLAEQLQSQLVSSLARLRHLDQSRTGILWPPGRLGRHGSDILDYTKDNGEFPSSRSVITPPSFRQSAAMVSQRNAQFASMEKSQITAVQVASSDDIASKRWFAVDSERPSSGTQLRKKTQKRNQTMRGAIVNGTMNGTIGAKAIFGAASSKDLPQLSMTRLSISSAASTHSLASNQPSPRKASMANAQGPSGGTDVQNGVKVGSRGQHNATSNISLRPSRRQMDNSAAPSEADDSTAVSGIISTLDGASVQQQHQQHQQHLDESETQGDQDPTKSNRSKSLQSQNKHQSEEGLTHDKETATQPQKLLQVPHNQAAQQHRSGDATTLSVDDSRENRVHHTHTRVIEKESAEERENTSGEDPAKQSKTNRDQSKLNPIADISKPQDGTQDLPSSMHKSPTDKPQPHNRESSSPVHPSQPSEADEVFPPLTASMLSAVDQGLYSTDIWRQSLRRSSHPIGRLPPEALPVTQADTPMVRTILARGGRAFCLPTEKFTILDEDGEVAIESILLNDWNSPNQPLLAEAQMPSTATRRRKPLSPAELASLLGLKLASGSQSNLPSQQLDADGNNDEIPLSPEDAIMIATAAQSQYDSASAMWPTGQVDLPPIAPGASTHEVLARKLLKMRQKQEEAEQRNNNLASTRRPSNQTVSTVVRDRTRRVVEDLQRSDVVDSKARRRSGRGPNDQDASQSGRHTQLSQKSRGLIRGRVHDRDSNGEQPDEVRDLEESGDDDGVGDMRNIRARDHKKLQEEENDTEVQMPLEPRSFWTNRPDHGKNSGGENTSATQQRDMDTYPGLGMSEQRAGYHVGQTSAASVPPHQSSATIPSIHLNTAAPIVHGSSVSQGGIETPPPDSATLTETAPIPDRRQSLGASVALRTQASLKHESAVDLGEHAETPTRYGRISGPNRRASGHIQGNQNPLIAGVTRRSNSGTPQTVTNVPLNLNELPKDETQAVAGDSVEGAPQHPQGSSTNPSVATTPLRPPLPANMNHRLGNSSTPGLGPNRGQTNPLTLKPSYSQTGIIGKNQMMSAAITPVPMPAGEKDVNSELPGLDHFPSVDMSTGLSIASEPPATRGYNQVGRAQTGDVSKSSTRHLLAPSQRM